MHTLAASLPKVPSDIRLSDSSPDLLKPRQFDWAEWYRKPENKLIVVSIGLVAVSTKLLGIDMWKATEECKATEEDGNKKVNRFKCASDIFGIVLALAGFVVARPLVFMQIQEWARRYGLRGGGGAHPPRSFLGNDNDINLDEHLENFSLHVRETSVPHLSDAFGVEVRHLGFWNGTVTPTALRKRDLGEPLDVLRPVYGATLGGRDIHFSFHEGNTAVPGASDNGTEGANYIAMRVALGDVPPRKVNTRDEINSIPWFEDGVGADTGIQTFTEPRDELRDSKREVAQASSAQISCYLGETFPYNNGYADAMHISLYDEKSKKSWMAAQVALYGSNGRSGLSELGGVRSNLPAHDHCTGKDGL